MTRVTRIVVCLVLATGCAEETSDYPDVRQELPNTHRQLGGGMALFAATVVDGGGAKGKSGNPPHVVLDVSKEFSGQFVAPGRVKLGRQDVTFRIISSSQSEENRGFRVPANGTRIIAFGDATGSALVVYANHVFADTEANQAAIMGGRAPAASLAFQFPLFLGVLGFAFAAIFLAWFRVKYGVIALAVSIALWVGYESTIPIQTIRIDLLIIAPLVLAATISVGVAAARGDRGRGGTKPRPRTPRRRDRR